MADGWITDEVARCGEMSVNVGLRIRRERDGDIILEIEENGVPLRLKNKCVAHVEFCAPGIGGGASPNVRKALTALMVAMKKDNKDSPYGDRTNPNLYPKNWED